MIGEEGPGLTYVWLVAREAVNPSFAGSYTDDDGRFRFDVTEAEVRQMWPGYRRDAGVLFEVFAQYSSKYCLGTDCVCKFLRLPLVRFDPTKGWLDARTRKPLPALMFRRSSPSSGC